MRMARLAVRWGLQQAVIDLPETWLSPGFLYLAATRLDQAMLKEFGFIHPGREWDCYLMPGEPYVEAWWEPVAFGRKEPKYKIRWGDPTF